MSRPRSLELSRSARGLLALLLGLSLPSLAQEEPAPVRLTPRDDRPSTVILLNTGEWIRGRVEYMNYGRLYFNSRKFDKVNFQWDDVYYLDSNEEYLFHLRHDVKIRGKIRVDETTVVITETDGTTREFPRGELLAIFPGERGLRTGRWFGKITGSVQQSSGNTDESSFEFDANITRRAGSLENIFQVNSSFAEADGDQIRARNQLVVQSNLDLSDRYYAVLERFELEYDKFQNIDRRYRGVVGLGLNLLRTSRYNWRIEGGPAYELTRFRDVTTDEGREKKRPGGYFATILRFDLTSDIDLTLAADSFVSSEEAKDANHSLRGTLSIDLARDFTVDFSVQWDRNETPIRLADGTVPERDDFRFLVGLGWEF